MRSVAVVLPASMWAMIPMLRTLARSILRRSVAIVVCCRFLLAGGLGLPAVVRERPVGFGHSVHVLAALHTGAEAVGGIEELIHQALGHAFFPARAGVVDQPAQGKGVAPSGTDLDRNLVRRATDTAAADLEGGLDVVQGAFERDDRVSAGLLAAALQGAVHDPLGGGLLPATQHLVHQLGHQWRAVDRVDVYRSLGGRALARHQLFSFFAP